MLRRGKFKTQPHDWFKTKNYLHFDLPISIKSRGDVEKYILNPKKIATHKFYPFIYFESVKYKMREDEISGVRFLDDSKARHLSYASHMDSLVYSYYASRLNPMYEEELDRVGLSDTVIAFRKLVDQMGRSKCTIHLANDAFQKISEVKNCKVLAFELKSFFDELNHKELKKAWCRLLGLNSLPEDHYNVFKSLSCHSLVSRSVLYKEFEISESAVFKNEIRRICEAKDFRDRVRGNGLIEKKNIGIPQGSSISAFLANVYMLEFDKSINRIVSEADGFYFRYCDDILIIVPEKNSHIINEAKVTSELAKIKLRLNTKKTDVSNFFLDGSEIHCDKPIQYLGFMFDGKRKYLRSSSISGYKRKARKAVKLAKQTQKKYNKIRREKGKKTETLYRKKLFETFSHTGNSNFITYGKRAADIMDSDTIKKQLKDLDIFLRREIEGIER